MAETAANLIQLVNEKVSFATGLDYEPDISRVINNSKVSDHHAIIPTAEISKQELQGLPAGERDILMLASMRLLCATALKQVYSETAITVECAGESFSANGKTVLSEGWKAIESAFKATLKEKNEKKTLRRFFLL
jgi:DNA topoisomerase-3